MSDQMFYALGLPPFGPGRTRRFDPEVRDVGRMAESDALEDAYRFRTPMLRNVALTSPYGHNGAYPDLEGIIRQHLDPSRSWEFWRQEMAALPAVPWVSKIDFVVWQDQRELDRQQQALDIKKVDLSDDEIRELVEFLGSLTGKGIGTPPFGVPERVPSGLPID